MKRRVLITITDTRRFFQFSLGQVVKWIALALFLALVAAAVSGWLYVRSVERAYDAALARQKSLEESRKVLRQRIEKLDGQIEARQRALDRLGDRLSDLETMINGETDLNATTSERVDNVTLSASQLALLFSIVPNGSPLPDTKVTGSFGWRVHPVRKRREFHAGLDLRAKTRKPVWTTADGIVEFAGYHKRSGYGNLVIIDHGFGFKTYYGHLARVNVRTGDAVIKGDVIGISGNTGLSTAPHLHYEVRFLTRPVNPYWLMRWEKRDYRMIFEKLKRIPWNALIAVMGHLAYKVTPPSSHREPE